MRGHFRIREHINYEFSINQINKVFVKCRYEVVHMLMHNMCFISNNVVTL